MTWEMAAAWLILIAILALFAWALRDLRQETEPEPEEPVYYIGPETVPDLSLPVILVWSLEPLYDWHAEGDL